MKKLMALVLALVMVFAGTTVSYAAEEEAEAPEKEIYWLDDYSFEADPETFYDEDDYGYYFAFADDTYLDVYLLESPVTGLYDGDYTKEEYDEEVAALLTESLNEFMEDDAIIDSFVSPIFNLNGINCIYVDYTVEEEGHAIEVVGWVGEEFIGMTYSCYVGSDEAVNDFMGIFFSLNTELEFDEDDGDDDGETDTDNGEDAEIDYDFDIEEGLVLVDNDEMTVTTIGAETDEYYVNILLEIENKTDEDLRFSTQNTMINNIYTTGYMYDAVRAGAVTECAVEFDMDELAGYGIDKIYELAFSIYATNIDYERVTESDIVVLETSDYEEDYEQALLDGEVIYEDNGIMISMIGTVLDYWGDEELWVLYVNDTDEPVDVYVTAYSCDDEEVEGSAWPTIPAHSAMYQDLYFSGTDIEDLGDISMNFEIMDQSWNDIDVLEDVIYTVH